MERFGNFFPKKAWKWNEICQRWRPLPLGKKKTAWFKEGSITCNVKIFHTIVSSLPTKMCQSFPFSIISISVLPTTNGLSVSFVLKCCKFTHLRNQIVSKGTEFNMERTCEQNRLFYMSIFWLIRDCRHLFHTDMIVCSKPSEVLWYAWFESCFSYFGFGSCWIRWIRLIHAHG